MKWNHEVLEGCRTLSGPYASKPRANYGAFEIPGPCRLTLRLTATPGDEETPWEHVSVSTAKRSPNAEEMRFVKDLFWAPEEPVMQLYVARSPGVKVHPYCLELWRPLVLRIPLPPV